MSDCHRVKTDVNCVHAAFDRIEGAGNVLPSPDFRQADLEVERAGRCLSLAQFQHDGGIAKVAHDRQMAETWNDLAQEFESLAGRIRLLEREAGGVAARFRKTRDESSTNRVPRCRENDGDGRRRLPGRYDYGAGQTRPRFQRRARSGPPPSDTRSLWYGPQASRVRAAASRTCNSSWGPRSRAVYRT